MRGQDDVDHAADVQRDVLLPGRPGAVLADEQHPVFAQQWIINKRMGVPPQFNLPKFR